MLNLKSACGYFMDFFMVGFQTNKKKNTIDDFHDRLVYLLI